MFVQWYTHMVVQCNLLLHVCTRAHTRTHASARAHTHTHTHTQVSQPSAGGLEEVQDTAIPDVLSSQVRMFVIGESER